jgi:hypothetical protein
MPEFMEIHRFSLRFVRTSSLPRRRLATTAAAMLRALRDQITVSP